MFDWFYNIFGTVMTWCYDLTNNYALALLFFAVIIKVLMLPFGIKQQKSQIALAKLRPKVAKIEKKYAGRNDRVTLQKKQQEIMELQQKEGYSPLSGCLPLLIQLPIIFGLYSVIRRPLSFICKLSDEAITAPGLLTAAVRQSDAAIKYVRSFLQCDFIQQLCMILSTFLALCKKGVPKNRQTPV